MLGELREVHASNIIKGDEWRGQDRQRDRVMVAFLYGSWNNRVHLYTRDIPLLMDVLISRNPKVKFIGRGIGVQVDIDDDSYDICIRENNELQAGLGAPSEMPAVVFIGVPADAAGGTKETEANKLRIEHLDLAGRRLNSYLSTAKSGWEGLLNVMQSTLSRLVDSEGKLIPTVPRSNIAKAPKVNLKPAIRLFIAGDKSQVGKSSICMGILGALLKSGKFAPKELAYIKPATQCEQTQLVQEFCKAKGITACVPVGPIVYYKGFTRAFLKGDIDDTSEALLRKAGNAVDDLAAGKKVVIIDGVGYPAVGSITGTDNASVAKSCGIKLSLSQNDHARAPTPVLLIGKSGVGDAVDSFNINATYFTHRDVPVIGAIFNKLSVDGFYSLSNCKEAIDMYFEKCQPDKTAFGFIPEIPSLVKARENIANRSEETQLQQALECADAFVDLFCKRVNVDAILKAATDVTNAYKQSYNEVSSKASDAALGKRSATGLTNGFHPSKLLKAAIKKTSSSSKQLSLTRAQIEAMASAAGAAGG